MSGGTTTEDLVEKFLSAIQRGEPVDEASFAAAHPEQAEELRELLPLLMEMESYGRNHRPKSVHDAPPDLTGSDYRLLKEIGRGGMWTVWV